MALGVGSLSESESESDEMSMIAPGGGRDGVMLAGRFLLVPAILEWVEGVAGVMGACCEKWTSSLAQGNKGILELGVGCAMATGHWRRW